MLRPETPSALVADGDRLGPPPRHAVRVDQVTGGVTVRALPGTPVVQGADPLPPSLPGRGPDIGVGLDVLREAHVDRLHEVATGGGVALPRLGHAGPRDPLRCLVPGHLVPFRATRRQDPRSRGRRPTGPA